MVQIRRWAQAVPPESDGDPFLIHHSHLFGAQSCPVKVGDVVVQGAQRALLGVSEGTQVQLRVGRTVQLAVLQTPDGNPARATRESNQERV